MKKNSIILGILIGLIAFIYWFEELGQQKRRLSIEQKTTAIKLNFEQIQKISLPAVTLIKKNNQYIVKDQNYPVDKEVLDNLLFRLGHLKIIRKFTNDERAKFNLDDLFSQNAPKVGFHFPGYTFFYQIGRKTLHDNTFYVRNWGQNVDELSLVQDNSPFDGIYLSEKSVHDQKYHQLLQLLNLPENQFFDRRVFTFNFALTKINQIAFENQRNRPFKLIFLPHHKTLPEVLNGLGYQSAQFLQISRDLLNLKGVKVFLTPTKRLSEKVSTIKFETQSKKQVILELNRKFGKTKGFFVKRSDQNIVYQLNDVDARIFYANVQDFWDKSVNFGRPLGKSDEQMELFFENKNLKKQLYFNVEIPLAQKIDIKLNKTSLKSLQDRLAPNQPAFRELLSLVLNENPSLSAYRVSELGQNYDHLLEQNYHKGQGFKFTIGGVPLRVAKRADELIISNLEKRYNLHYLVPSDKMIGMDTFDYFFIKEKKSD